MCNLFFTDEVKCPFKNSFFFVFWKFKKNFIIKMTGKSLEEQSLGPDDSE